MATDPLQVKHYLAIEVYVDNAVLFAPKISTGFKQESLIPRNWFRRGEKFFVAPFLCNSKELFSGDNLRGRWIEVLLAGDPDQLETYSELTGVIIFANGVEKTGT